MDESQEASSSDNGAAVESSLIREEGDIVESEETPEKVDFSAQSIPPTTAAENVLTMVEASQILAREDKAPEEKVLNHTESLNRFRVNIRDRVLGFFWKSLNICLIVYWLVWILMN